MVLKNSRVNCMSKYGVRSWSQGAVLLLSTYGDFDFQVYYLTGKRLLLFLLLLLLLCVCKACLLLVRITLFCLKFFKGFSCLFLVKLVDQSQFFFFLALLFPSGNFCFWTCIFFFLDFIFINFFTDFRMRKILYLQIFVMISGYQ